LKWHIDIIRLKNAAIYHKRVRIELHYIYICFLVIVSEDFHARLLP